jgi:hypothetical protein
VNDHRAAIKKEELKMRGCGCTRRKDRFFKEMLASKVGWGTFSLYECKWRSVMLFLEEDLDFIKILCRFYEFPRPIVQVSSNNVAVLSCCMG